MKRADTVLPPTKESPTATIKRVLPKYEWNFKKCEVALNIGVFFDGTNNNKDRDSPKLSDTNISRLHDSYNGDKVLGYNRIYIPGAGTKFPDIGELGESKFGSGCAFGCEGRAIFGLLEVFNALHRHSYKVNLFNKGTILALCRNSINVTDSEDRDHLAKLGIYYGLLQTSTDSDRNRRDFLKRQASFLEEKLKNGKPRVVECFIDVFGFSRGAAQARVFCHWLDELLVDGRLAGVPIRFRFVGIMDTVASAGFWSSMSAMLSNSTGWHGAWASGEALRLPASVENCVHMVAMHELRRNFPSDEISVDSKLQPGWIQLAYPGAHSDVGGGYEPGELGIATGDDSRKLSQIPLNHMLDCAMAAGAPMTRPQPPSGSYNAFAIHPDLTKAYAAFISEATTAARPMYEWLQLYINWRWQVRQHFHTTSQVKQASQAEKKILLAFNDSLINDAAAMTRSAALGIGMRTIAAVSDIFYAGARKDLLTTVALEPEAREVFALAQRAKPTPSAFAALFDGYVHDSLAGFNSPSLELTGYWRYRRVFLGSDGHTLAANQDADAARSIA